MLLVIGIVYSLLKFRLRRAVVLAVLLAVLQAGRGAFM
jgi:hypothetical protein